MKLMKILESTAGDQAKKMGLEYLGFGRYGHRKGETASVTHTVSHGKLVPIKKPTSISQVAGHDSAFHKGEPINAPNVGKVKPKHVVTPQMLQRNLNPKMDFGHPGGAGSGPSPEFAAAQKAGLRHIGHGLFADPNDKFGKVVYDSKDKTRPLPTAPSSSKLAKQVPHVYGGFPDKELFDDEPKQSTPKYGKGGDPDNWWRDAFHARHGKISKQEAEKMMKIHPDLKKAFSGLVGDFVQQDKTGNYTWPEMIQLGI